MKTDIWRLQAHKLPPRRFFWITQLRIVLLGIRRFVEDKCDSRASALTFYSLLSIVPVVAMAFAVAKGFGVEKILAAQLLAKLEGQEEVAERIITFAQSLLQNTKGGAIAGVGIVVLLWTVVKVLGNIEASFNDIWGVKTPRSLGRKLADYLSVMMLCPILLITASSVTVLVTTRVTAMLERLSFLGYLANVVVWSLKILPYAVIWVVFTFIYAFMPNTKVQLKSAVWAGILAGTIYQLTQLVYITFQIGVANYGAIYGSFAALPLFLVWLQLSWLILLLGAELSFAHQNVATYEFESDCRSVSHSFKRLVALLVACLSVKRFLHAEKPLTAEAISRELEVPIRLVRSVLFELRETGVLSQVCVNDGVELAYQPACDLHRLTVGSIIQKLDERGIDAIPIGDSSDLTKIQEILARLLEAAQQSPANLELEELCTQPKQTVAR
ncbi:MAG: YihY/virulence factor BrkB family protein [Alphaproteobacteria bacterium]